MGLTQPENNIVLPKELDQAIETAKNRLTLIEGEVARLTRLKSQTNLELSTLETSMADWKNKIAEKEIVFSKLELDTKNLLAEKDNVEKQLLESQEEVKQNKAWVTSQLEEISSQKKRLVEEFIILENNQKKVVDNSKRLEEALTSFNEKKNKLLDILKEF